MPIFKEHFPSSFEFKFQTFNDLMKLDCVNKWTKNPHGQTFYRFSIKHNHNSIFRLLEPEDNSIKLMAEMNNGERRYIIGEIYGLSPKEIGLPECNYKYKRVE